MLYWISALSLAAIAIIMLVRANDLRASKRGLHWKVRMLGFFLCGITPWVILATEPEPTLWQTLFRVGMVAVFTTTPHLPPFWNWLWKGNDGDVA